MAGTKFKLTWPERSSLSKGAFEIVMKLRKSGFEAFIAGGAVRDALLKRPIAEIDIATSAKPQEVKKLFKKTIPTGEKHGTITVFYPPSIPPLSRGGNKGGEEHGTISVSTPPFPSPSRGGNKKRKFLPLEGGGKVGVKEHRYEVTTFRAEGPYKDHRHPSKVRFLKTAEEDAKRRDFTVNALFYDPQQSIVIDYVDGIADISHRRIRFIGISEDRIREDALRMLRAVRFATVLRFDLSREAEKTIQKNAKLITKISAERIKIELDKILASDRASVGFGLLDIVGLLEYVLPEIKNMQGVSQPKNQHSEGDVYAHSLLALEKLDDTFDLATRWAVLLHDVGKPQTRQIRDGKITFYEHMQVGEQIVKKLGKRLKFSNHETDKIAWLVRNHMVPNDFQYMKLSTRRKWGLNQHFPDLLKVFKADAQASLPAKKGKKPDLNAYKIGLQILEEIKKKPELKKPILTGHEVMKILKIKEGPLVGRVLKMVEEAKLAGKIGTKGQAKKYLQRNKNLVK